MNFILQIFLMATFVLVSSSCAPPAKTPAETGESYSAKEAGQDSVATQLGSIAQRAVANGVVEGIQFSLVDGTEPLATLAFGVADRERQIAMTAATPINVASISKSLTAWGMLALLEEKQLTLDAPVRPLLGDTELYDEIFPGVDVTVRMLLSHTSGLSGASVPVTPATRPIPGLNDILLGRSSVRRARLQDTPGKSFRYSGAGYLVLQKIIEEQSGQSFADYMTKAVLAPARMSDSSFALTPGIVDRVAVYYRADGRRREPYHLPGAAGGLYSTAADMARYLDLYLDVGRQSRSGIVSDERFRILLAPVAIAVEGDHPTPDIQYALGHYTYETPAGERIVFHTGGNPGLRAIYIVAPGRDLGFFAVANSDNGSEVFAEMVRVWGEHYGLTLHEYF